MAEPTDDPTEGIDRRIDAALSESQRLEREELAADLERQRAADERVVDALSKQRDA